MNLSLEKKSIVEGRLNKNELYFFFKHKNKPERIPVQPAFAKSNLFFIKYKKALKIIDTHKPNIYQCPDNYAKHKLAVNGSNSIHEMGFL